MTEGALKVRTAHSSYMQKAMWFLDRMGAGAALNVLFGFQIDGPFDVDGARQAIGSIVARHDVLRSVFLWREGELWQVHRSDARCEIDVVDVSSARQAECAGKSAEIAAELAEHIFDLEAAPPFRCTVLRLAPKRHELWVNMHHIITDGWSLGIFVDEFNLLYAAHLSGTPPKLPRLEHKFSDIAKRERKEFENGRFDEQIAYWKRELAGAPSVIRLPIDEALAAGKYHGDLLHTNVDAALTRSLRELSRRLGVTLFMMMLAVFQLYLYRSTRQADIVIGVPIATRSGPEAEKLIGLFVNMIAIRAEFEPTMDFCDLLAQTKRRSIEAYANSDVPFGMLVNALNPKRTIDHHPLVQIMFGARETIGDRLRVPGATAKPLALNRSSSALDLSLFVTEVSDCIRVTTEFNAGLFSHATVDRFVAEYIALLQSIAECPSQGVASHG